MHTTTRRLSSRALVVLGAPLLIGAALSAPAPAAQAAPTISAVPAVVAPAPVARTTTTTTTTTTPPPTRAQTRRAKARAFGKRAVKVASTRKGSAYSYGAVGPRRFDCSGLTMWTFKRLGRTLPHSSAAQYGRTKHLRASDRRPGDLVFFHDGGGIYHVAIYAGHNQIWHAPYSGTRVRKDRIWTRSVYYGRVR